MMTEQEAATKWCPHVVASHTNPRDRRYVDGDGLQNSGSFNHACLGASCMAWRWRPPGFDHNLIGETYPARRRTWVLRFGRPAMNHLLTHHPALLAWTLAAVSLRIVGFAAGSYATFGWLIVPPSQVMGWL